VHGDESALKCIVRVFKSRVEWAEVLDLVLPRLEVRVPYLVAAGELLQGTLVDDVLLLGSRRLLVLNVTQPVLDRVRVSQRFLFVRDVLVFLRPGVFQRE
jgi:hypothetical protein